MRWTHIAVVVGAGSPAKRPGLLANLHLPFSVATTTVFAGKPAPTTILWERPCVAMGRKAAPVISAF